MSKKERYYDEAEILYVKELNTVDEIASKLFLAEKTVRLWKSYGDWDLKRKIFIKSKSSVHEELYEVIKNLISSVNEDLANKQKVDAARMYAMTKMVPMMVKIKEYEDLVNKKQDSDLKKTLTPEDVMEIEELLGIRRHNKEA